MQKRKHFTLVEIMIVVAIIGLLAAIAIPSFMKARESTQENACVENLRIIHSAAEQYMMSEGATSVDLSDDEDDLLEYIDGDSMPECPIGGSYSVNSDGDIECDEHNHDQRGDSI